METKKESFGTKMKIFGRTMWSGVKKAAPVVMKFAVLTGTTIVGNAVYGALTGDKEKVVECQVCKITDVPEESEQ